MWHITWDPTEETATRPLAIRKDGTWYCYGWDLTKNICEVFKSGGYIGTAYTYTPYGAATPAGTVTQPIQWSSEYADTETALTYYNYRHYNPYDGRWLGRDRQFVLLEKNIYIYCLNDPISSLDMLGKLTREQREIKRDNAKSRQKTGRFINKEKTRQTEIDNMANQKSTNYIGSQSGLASGVNLLDNMIGLYLIYATNEATVKMMAIIENVEKICQQAKSKYKNIEKDCEGCCTLDIIATHFFMEGRKIYDGIKDYKAHYSAWPCNRTSYMRAPDKPFTTTFDIEIPMIGESVILY